MDIDEWDGAKEVEIETIKSLMMHKIGALQIVSQNVHNSYISLQGAEFQCSKELALLSPLFTTWGPYTQFFHFLVPLLPQKNKLPKVVIINAKNMINRVKELHGFFLGKM